VSINIKGHPYSKPARVPFNRNQYGSLCASILQHGKTKSNFYNALNELFKREKMH